MILSILIAILFIIWAPFVILTNISFINYGWAVNATGFNLPIYDQTIRLWLLLFSSLILCTSCFNIYFGIRLYQITKFKRYMFAFGFFSWIYIFVLLMLNNEIDFIKIYYRYLSFKITNYQVSFIHLFKHKFDAISRNTILYIFTLIITFIAFVFVFIPNNSSNAYLEGTIIYHGFSFFTRLSNLGCFLFILFFIFFQTININKNNSLAIYMCSYISVVALVYWIVLFPQNISDGSFISKTDYAIAEAIWMHAIAPIFFLWFVINSWTLNGINIDRKIKPHLLMINLYPLWYFSYAYFIPFLVKESVYGSITNLNPDGYIYTSNGFVKNGNPAFILSIFGFGLVFVLIYLLYRIISIKITNNKFFYNNKVSFN